MGKYVNRKQPRGVGGFRIEPKIGVFATFMRTHVKVTSMDELKKTENFRFRILDASVNRASEGLRVVEDFARMGLNDAFLSGQLKQLRHDLKVATDPINSVFRLQARDSELDVGRSQGTVAEYKRVNTLDLIRSNMARVQQALRTIEEYSKSFLDEVVPQAEQLRYRAYSLEKAIVSCSFNQQRLEGVHLYVLIDGCDGDWDKLARLCGSIAHAGAGLIQLRDKSLDDRQLVTAGKAIADAIRDSKCRWIMNDRADLAVAAGADGVHLGQEDMTVHAGRQILGPGKIIGVSTHDIEQARQAVIDGADYIGIGPTFPSNTKSFDNFPGLEFVQAIVKEISLPAFAIGGIDLQNVNDVVACGCQRVAVASAVTCSDDPAQAVADLMQPLQNSEES